MTRKRLTIKELQVLELLSNKQYTIYGNPRDIPRTRQQAVNLGLPDPVLTRIDELEHLIPITMDSFEYDKLMAEYELLTVAVDEDKFIAMGGRP